MIVVYLICVIASIVLCAWYFYADVRRSAVQNIMLLVLVVASMGYLSLALSDNLTGAIFSSKIIYVGGIFLPPLFFITVCQESRIPIRSWVLSLMFLVQGFLFFLVCTIEYNHLYYLSMAFAPHDGVGDIVKTYGPLHVLFPITLYGYLAAALIVAIVTCIVKKNVEKTSMLIMIAALFISSISYILQIVLKAKYNYTPITYIFLMTAALAAIYRTDIYDVVENGEVIHEQLGSIGFLTFDGKMKFMGGNEYALNLFPSLRDEEIGKRLILVPDDFKTVYREVEMFLEEREKIKRYCFVEGSNFRIGDRTFKTKIHSLHSHTNRCVGAMLEFRDITEHTRMIELTEKYNEQLESEVWLKTERIRDIQQKTILGMAQMVESRDTSTGGHIKRTSEVVRIFSKKLLEADMGFDKHFLELVIRSAPMHDLGKIGVDDAVLRKQGKFTDEEYEKMKKHSEVGGKMVTEILSGVEEKEFVKVAFNVANYHHEKVNGKGYPVGLIGEEIPIEARIMALADVFDALVSKRCYKDAFSYDKAFSIITEDAGSHFDAKLVPIFLSCREELEAYYNNEA